MKRVFILLLLIPAFFACKEDARNIQITYDQVYGLREGNFVRFDGRPIGAVTGIFYSTQQQYVVDVSIDMAFVNAVTEESLFPIVEDPEVEGEKAIEVVNTARSAPALKEGAVVEGTPPPDRDLSQLGDEIQRGIEDFQEEIGEFVEGLGGISRSEEFKRLQGELSQMAEAMRRSGKAMHDKVQKEVLPRIQEELERLRKKLEELGREEEVRPLEDQVEEMMEREI